MAPRKFLKIEAGELEMLAEHLGKYAEKCRQAAEELRKSGITHVVTDGFKSTRDGLVRLRKLIKEFVGEVGLPNEEELDELLNQRLKDAGYETTTGPKFLQVAETKKSKRKPSDG